jgi:selenocysteine-specific elongation factor
MHIIGTAGHVDHGKSSLVRALTGTNPDRWLEEQKRGMTLDLGFAHLRFAGGLEAGIVDVPGHERFLHNMLAGAAGMELLLLVVAADEGVRPQTVEHVQILRYLNVQKCIVAVTKADVLTAGDLAFAQESIREQLRGTLAEDAEAIAVSSVTGFGLDTLRQAIAAALSALPARDAEAPAYLPIDRVFALAGHGTVVTGTLMQGSIAVGEELVLQPSGAAARVRSIQTFGEKKERVQAGARVALNLPLIEVRDIARGEVLAAPQFAPAKTFDVTFFSEPSASTILRRRNAVRVYIGSAEIIGTLVLEEQPQLHLRAPAVVYPDMPFVVRRLSPKNLLGGGRIRAHALSAPELAADEAHTPAQVQVLGVLQHSSALVLRAEELARDANLREDAVRTAISELLERGDVLEVTRPQAYAERGRAGALLAGIVERMRAQQQSEPWSMGLTSLAISRSTGVDEGTLQRLLIAFAEEGMIAARSGYFSTTDFVPALTAEQQQFFEEALAADPASPFVPVPLARVVAVVKQSRIPGIGKAFDTLLAKGTLVKVNDELYRGSQIAAIRARVDAYLQVNKQMTMAQFRDVIGTSRKYAVPLLEWFDARGITVRSGDYRMLRGKAQ